MQRASRRITDDDRKRVGEVVATAESKTTAEIVPVVATAAGRYDRAEDMVGLIAGLGAFILAWLLFQREDPEAGGWNGLPLTLQLPILVAIIIVGLLAGTLIATRVAWLRRLLTPRQEMQDEVDDLAARLFHDQRIHHTDASTGVLVLVCLLERRAVILADQLAFEKLGSDTLDEQCRELTGALRAGAVTDALCGTIERLGTRLAEVLPRDDSREDTDELPNALVTID